MENSLNESEVQQSFRSPPRRRRSTFFERRESIVPQSVTTENMITDSCNDETESEKRHRYYSSYYTQLQLEKDQWKKETIERRNNYHDLRQQYKMAAKSSSTSRISYETLTNEDIEFLKRKSSISKLCELQRNLHKSLKETVVLMKRVNELDDLPLSYSEDKFNQINDYILENSSIEPINN